jgi:undecaprenyl diphosphate synthase
MDNKDGGDVGHDFASQSEIGSAGFAMQSAGQHVAIIMDGNGRWAARRGLPRVAGHRAGVAAVRRVVERAPEVGIATLTVYAFSSDNWRRPAFEVQSILSLIAGYLRLERDRLREAGVRLEAIGRRDRLPRILLREIEQCEAATAAGGRLHLRVAVDYSSREAMARAAAQAAHGLNGSGTAEGVRRAMAETLRAEGGDVDLLIRTGGEKRLSDFLLWESAYAELVFTEVMWPEFGAAELDAAVGEFRGRERRFGGVGSERTAESGERTGNGEIGALVSPQRAQSTQRETVGGGR